jgi:hypothetical protein
MKITITPQTVPPSAPFTLAGNVPSEAPAGLRQNGVRLLQVVEKFRAASVEVFDRKNTRNTFEFQVKRTFATNYEAEQFLLEHEDAVPRVGRIEFLSTADTGSGTTSKFMTGGVPSVVLVEHKGASVTHAYIVVGGKLTSA